MNCKQCGAPLNVLENQSLFHCEYCGGYDFPDPNLDGVALLDQTSAYLCPMCRKPLVSAAVSEVRIFSCPNCRGNLIDQSKLLPILRQAQASGMMRDIPVVSADPSEWARSVDCPSCLGKMNTYPYGGPGNMMIQGCDQCRVIWLDCGELSRIVRAYSEMYSDPSDELGAKKKWIAF